MKETRLRDIRLLAVDLDGTALDDDKKLSPETLDAFGKLMENGIYLCISSGRCWPGISKYAQQVRPNAPVISCNGALLLSPSGEVLQKTVLDEEDALRILSLAEERDTSVVIWLGNTLYANRLNDRTLDYGRRYGGGIVPVIGVDHERMAREGIQKILWYDTVEKARVWSGECRDWPLKNVNIFTSEPGFIEFFSKDVSKGSMLMTVCDRLNVPGDSCCAVGDGENDIPMLQAAAFSAAMGNAADEVKRFADMVLLSNNENGVAKLIWDILYDKANG